MLYHDVIKRGRFSKFYSYLATLWLLLDISVVILVLFAILTVFGIEIDHYFIVISLVSTLCIFFVYPLIELFNRIRTRPIVQESLYLFKAWYRVVALLLCVGYFTGQIYFYPVEVIFIWVISAYLGQLSMHLGARCLMNRLRGRGCNIRYAVLVGTRNFSQRFHAHLLSQQWMGIELVGYISEPEWENSFDKTRPEIYNMPLLGGLDSLEQVIEDHFVGEVFITLPSERSDVVEPVAKALLNFPINAYWVPSASLPTYLNHYISNINGNPVICISDSPIRMGQQFLKRGFDVVCSLILLVLIAPFLALIAIVVKLSSPGPIIYKQVRQGLYGEKIQIWKFRTMRMAKEGEIEKQAIPSDSRITPIGKILRRWSIDELPQLFNVLQGKLSIVGPRPHPVWLNEKYKGEVDAYMLRHHVRPGITGWAQVNGLRGETDTVKKMNDRLLYDLHYINHWSPLLDLKICLMTFKVVIVGENAY